MTYVARASAYGSAKYERSNFLRAVSDAGPARADFERYRAYLRATLSHIVENLDAMEEHQANDPHLADIEGMLRAAFAADTDATPGAPVGASGLPHIAHAAASLNMALAQAVNSGLLPRDPGQPWHASVPARKTFAQALDDERDVVRVPVREDALDGFSAAVSTYLSWRPEQPEPGMTEFHYRTEQKRKLAEQFMPALIDAQATVSDWAEGAKTPPQDRQSEIITWCGERA